MEAYHSLPMADAEVEKTTVNIGISNEPDTFNATGEVVKFDGFLHVYRESIDDDAEQEDETRLLPPLKKGQVLQHQSIIATERFTQHPPRYTEASLVRKLEELGIGRPSTYAPTILPYSNAVMWRKVKEPEKSVLTMYFHCKTTRLQTLPKQKLQEPKKLN